jgi:uncharacterized protein
VAGLTAVADTGPLVAATNRNDPAHELARAFVERLGPRLAVLDSVLVETDYLVRSRLGSAAARALLGAVNEGEISAAFLTPGLLDRAGEIDARFADLDLGLVDASVMAYAERHELPILTFDFAHFRAASPARRPWRLVVDEALYTEATGRG